MERGNIAWAAAAAMIWIVITTCYFQSASKGVIREEFELRETDASPNIIYFGHGDYYRDGLEISYTVGNESYTLPDEEGKYFEVDLERRLPEDIDRRILSGAYDGYFIGDDLRDDRMYRIKGVVKENVCYYHSQEIMFGEMQYRTVYSYDKAAGKVFVQHHPDYWRYMLYGWIMVFFLAIGISALRDGYLYLTKKP